MIGTLRYKSVKIRGRFKPYWQINELAKKIEGDVIYVSKPLFTSLSLGLKRKLFDGKPVILDIDDWEMGSLKDGYKNRSWPSRFKFLAVSALYFYSVHSCWNIFFSENNEFKNNSF